MVIIRKLVSCVLVLFVGGSSAQSLSISNNGPVIEGSNLVITVDRGSSLPSAEVVTLTFTYQDPKIYLATSYDIPSELTTTTAYTQVTIDALANAGTVSIPILGDAVYEPDVLIDVTIDTPGDQGSNWDGTTDTVTIQDNNSNTEKVTCEIGQLDPNIEFFEGDVGGSIPLITVDVSCFDVNQNPTPAEEDFTIRKAYPTPAKDTAEENVDFATGAPMVIATGTTGVGTVVFTVDLFEILPNADPNDSTKDYEESLESFTFNVGDAGDTYTDVRVFSPDGITVWIRDNDLKESYVVVTRTSLKRRGNGVLYQHILSNGAAAGYSWSKYGGDTLKRISRKTDSQRGSWFIYTFKIVRPGRGESAKRFGLYEWTIPYTLNGVRAFNSLWSTVYPERKRLMSDTSIILVYPDANDVTKLAKTQVIGVTAGDRYQREYRWRRNGAIVSGSKRRNILRIKDIASAGVYELFREGRSKGGWGLFCVVTVAECPEGLYSTVTGSSSCDQTCPVCYNGGTCYKNGFCICPPGYAGKQCEDIITGTIFGQNSFAECTQIPNTYRAGRSCAGVAIFGFGTFGSHCAPGYTGTDCASRCATDTFGPQCKFQCNCVDDICGVYGKCVNGCSDGWSGNTCQVRF